MYRVRVNWTGLPGGNGVSTLHFAASAGNPTVCVEAVNEWLDDIKIYISDDVDMLVDSQVDTIKVDDGELLASSIVPTVGFTGLNPGQILPSATQLLIREFTSDIVNGRRVRGKIFVPGFCEAESDAGRPISSIVAQMSSAASLFLTTPDAPLVVWHRPTAALPSSGSEHIVDTCTAWSEWAVLRSRRQ